MLKIMPKHYCVKCSKQIKEKHRLLCDECKIEEYRKLMRKKHEHIKKEEGLEDDIKKIEQPL